MKLVISGSERHDEITEEYLSQHGMMKAIKDFEAGQERIRIPLKGGFAVYNANNIDCIFLSEYGDVTRFVNSLKKVEVE